MSWEASKRPRNGSLHEAKTVSLFLLSVRGGTERLSSHDDFARTAPEDQLGLLASEGEAPARRCGDQSVWRATTKEKQTVKAQRTTPVMDARKLGVRHASGTLEFLHFNSAIGRMPMSGVWTFECGSRPPDGDQNPRPAPIAAQRSAPTFAMPNLQGRTGVRRYERISVTRLSPSERCKL